MTIVLDKLETRHKVTFFISALILSSILLFLFYLQPQQDKLRTLEAEVAVQQRKVQEIQNFFKANPVPENYQKTIDQRLVTVNQLLPNSTDMSAFLSMLEQYAKTSGVQVSFVNPTTPKAKQGYTEIPIEVAVKGKFEQVQMFVRQVEGGQRLAGVSKTSMKSVGPDVHARMMVLVYTFGNTKDKKTESPGSSS